MARYTSIVMTLALLATLFLSVQAGGATVTYDQMQTSIDDGLAWLETQQNRDSSLPESFGSWGEPDPIDPYDCTYHHRVEKTSLAVLKMNERARELGTSPDPKAQDGLNFIFRKVQEDGSIWDYYDTKKCGFENAPDTVTETSLAIMAIVSTGTPDTMFLDTSDPQLPANGKTYYQIVENAVSHLAWTQRTREEARMSGFDDVGGWTGGKDPAWIDEPYFSEKPADQIHTGIASLALVHAREKFGITSPAAILSQLKTWVGNTQDYPGSGGAYYWAPPFPAYPNVYYTGDLLIEQYLLGRTTADRDVQASLRYISDNWGARTPSYTGYKDYMDQFMLTRGLSLAGIEALSVAGSEVDWFDAILNEVINKQEAEAPGAYWPDDNDDDARATGWALLTMEGHVYPGEMAVTKIASATEVLPGTIVLYTYEVENTGRSAIYDLTLVDDRLETIDTLDAGDDNNNGILEPGETWMYTKDAVLSVTTRNIGTASGVDLLDRKIIARSNPVTVIVNDVTGMDVSIDIKPGSCPNAFNLGEVGVITVAVLGTEDFDVTQIDPETIYLGTVRALPGRWSYEDVATPYEDLDPLSDPIPEDCTTFEADGFLDLTVKFNHRELAASLSPVPLKNDLVPLTLTGSLKPEFGGTPLAGTDYIWVVE